MKDINDDLSYPHLRSIRLPIEISNNTKKKSSCIPSSIPYSTVSFERARTYYSPALVYLFSKRRELRIMAGLDVHQKLG